MYVNVFFLNIDSVLGDVNQQCLFKYMDFFCKNGSSHGVLCSMTYLTLQVQRRVSTILSDLSEPGSLGALTWDPGRLPF